MKTLSEVLSHLVSQSSWFSEADRDEALAAVANVEGVTWNDTQQGPEESVDLATTPQADSTTVAAPTEPPSQPEPTPTPEPSTTSDSSSTDSSDIAGGAGEVAALSTDPATPAPSAVPAVDETEPAVLSTAEAGDLSSGAAEPTTGTPAAPADPTTLV